MDEQTTSGTEPPGQPAGGQQPVPPCPRCRASTVVLPVISGLLTPSCYGAVIGLAPLVLSIIAMTRDRQEPARGRQLTRIGWIVLPAVDVVVLR